jgi:ligand-binding sensor domain-containing protein
MVLLAGILGSGSTGVSAATAGPEGSAATEPPGQHGEEGKPVRLPRLVDRFDVGSGVYVRALAMEPEANALWVGTSVGVLEIDLADHSVRQTFTRDDGLANEYVFAIGIDPQGYKWFGTNAGGASKYKDGEWKTFFPMHGLADYWIYSFAWQPDGTQWIGTWAGVNKRAPGETGFVTYVDELVNEWVYGIAVDSKSRVWFGTEGGISRFDGENWVAWTHADGLGAPNADGRPFSDNTGLGTRSRHDLGVLSGGEATYNPNYVFAVHIDPDDTLWVGTWGAGVARFDGENWVNYTTKDGLAGDIVYAIAQEPSGTLWFGTNGGITRFADGSWQTYGFHEGLTDLNVYALAVAPNGDLWAGTKGAVVRLSPPQAEDQSDE